MTDDVHVVDSGSTDGTIAIAEAAGARVVHHPFENYGKQRNWAIANVPLRYGWQLHLDADERLSGDLRAEILQLPDEPVADGYLLGRYVQFLGRVMMHGGMSPTWHMRLFRTGMGRCEQREYDQHFLCDGRVESLRGAMIDDIRMPLTEWTARHNKWADAEVREMLRVRAEDAEQVKARAFGSKIEMKRWLRARYNSAPLFVRPFGLFFYRYVLRLGVLDGMEGLIFWTLQTFWFRFLVDAKLWEARRAGTRASS